MISIFSSWARGIVIAVVVSNIIELIIPNGSSKKYVKSVIGIYILFVILSPITKKVAKNVSVNEIIEEYQREASKAESNFESKIENRSNDIIKDIYISNLKDDMKKKLEEKGYNVDNSVIKIKDDESYSIEFVKLYMSNSTEKRSKIKKIEVNNIEIGEKVNKYKLNENEQEEVKEYLNQNYGVSKENIEIV